MIQLPNGRKAGKFGVHPKNWESKTADPSLNWYVSYRYYESGVSKQRILRDNVNRFKTVEEKQKIIRTLIRAELNALMGIEEQEMTVREAFDYALKNISVSERTQKDIKHILKTVDRNCLISDFR